MRAILSFHPPFIQIARALVKNGYEIFTLHPQFTKMLHDSDMDVEKVKSLANLGTAEISERSYRDAITIVDALRKPFAMNGFNLSKSAEEFIKNGIAPYLYSKLPDIVSLIYVLAEANPDIIILHNDVEPANRAIALWAKAHGVPCLHVPHAVYIDSAERGDIGTDIHDIVTASYLAASGDFQKEWYQKRGMPLDNVRITGLPHFDKFSSMKVNRDFACNLMGMRPGKPVVTFASSWRQNTNLHGFHDGIEQTYLAFLQAAKHFGNSVQFVVKAHPRSNEQALNYHMETAKKIGARVIVTATHLEIVLQATNVLFSYGPSNVLLEAAHLGNIALMATHGYDRDKEVVKVGNDPKHADIIGAVKATLSSTPPNMSAFLYKYCGPADGKASERIVEFVENICHSK